MLDLPSKISFSGPVPRYFLRNELLTGKSKKDKNFRTYGMRHEKNFGDNFKFL